VHLGLSFAWRVLSFGKAGSAACRRHIFTGAAHKPQNSGATFGISPTWEPIMGVKFIPDGYHTVTPYLTVRNAPKVIEFLMQAFGAKLSHDAIKRPDGSIMHAQVTIGDSHVMIAEENEMAKATVSTLYVYVPDVDSVYQQAIKAGGSNVMEPMDMFYGDRGGGVRDPSGNSWFIATHKEDVEPNELAKRAEAFHKQQKGKAA
jgi:PhnB protein